VAVARRRVDPAERALVDLAGAIQALEEARPRKLQIVDTPKEEPKEDKPPAPALATYRPQPGPQTELETTDAEEILFGGAAGPGKTTGAIGALRERVKLRGYRAIVFRRTSTELTNAIARAKEIYRDGRPVGKFAFAPFAPRPLCRFVQSGAGGTLHFDAWGSSIVFAHCHKADDYIAHMGQEYDDMVFDEGPAFTRAQIENLISRRRGIVGGIIRRAILTANPPEDFEPGNEWMRQKWAPWVNPDAKVEAWTGLDDGGNDELGIYHSSTTVTLVGLPARHDANGKQLPPARSGQILYVAKDATGVERFSAEPFVWNGVAASKRTFIGATLRDNPALLDANPGYVQSLRQLDPVRRKQLEEGDWTVRRSSGTMFRREWFQLVELHERPPESDIVDRVRCWDKAATVPSTTNPDPNWTRGLRGALLKDGRILIEHLASCRFAPGERDDFIKTTAKQDGHAVRIRGPQDPGAAGVTDVVAFRKLLAGHAVKTETISNNKVLRASPASSFAHPKSTGGIYGNIMVLRGDWNDAFFGEIEGFPGGKDDIVDTLSDVVDELVNHPQIDEGPTEPMEFEDDYRFGDQRGY
jgi:phage terminase large subunit-like protein